jgi:hypothetical protein
MIAENIFPSTENIPGSNVKQGKGVVGHTGIESVGLAEERLPLNRSHALIFDLVRKRPDRE